MRQRTILFVVVCIALLIAASVAAADAKKPSAKKSGVSDAAQKSRGTASDENIKSRTRTNKAGMEPPAPPAKGGQKSRDVCAIHIDNRTPWIIDVYAGGDYADTVGRYGDVYGYINTRAAMYAVAEFDDGSSLTWGPRVLSCSGNTTWTLTR